MKISVPQETFPGERRVALSPDAGGILVKKGLSVQVQTGAGDQAGFTDDAYRERGAEIVADRAELFHSGDIVLQVRGYGANPQAGKSDLELLRAGQVLVGMYDPLASFASAGELARRNVSVFALELLPRITRAQSMDVLSSQATIAGYKAVVLAAMHAPRMFPMMMTAAGTISAAHVYVIGAGVAGLQAIATSRRMGAVVKAYDVRPAVKEQIESLGAKFVEMELDTAGAEDRGGYAKEMGEDFLRRQRELMTRVVAECHVVISTAVIPGKKAPVLITGDMVRGMMPGSVLVDLAAERGGNCELTRPDETVVEHGVTILGPTNLPATVPLHASQMYGRNMATFVQEITKDGALALNMENEVQRDTLLTRDGEVVNPRVRELLGLPVLEQKTSRVSSG